MNKILDPADAYENHEKIILRDHLALERTKLANERTLFSYIGTALYLLTVGLGIFEIDVISHLTTVGWICIITGFLLLIIGVFRFLRMKRHLGGYIEKQKSS